MAQDKAKSAARREKMGRMATAIGESLTAGAAMGGAGRAIGKGLRKRTDERRDSMGGRRKAERER